MERVNQMKEGVNHVVQKAGNVVENKEARNEAIKGVNDKVKGMFTTAFVKFNEIVEKNKANLPEIDIADLLAQNDLLLTQNYKGCGICLLNSKYGKHSLNDFIKKQEAAAG